ncbi:MAG: type I-C CRISPR-associated protein Cas8c/Csd1 [Alphaproteobacteria bacterium]|nr:type I-C CRISPR-associated protein Cas8c/Csd1 [Alphaproteobacteria bacterium]
MTILQSLATYYERLRARGDAAVEGYAPQKISFELVLTKDGTPVSLNDIRVTNGKKLGPQSLETPSVSRTSGIEPAFLWDKTAYTLGVTDVRTEQEEKSKVPAKPGSGKRTADEHAAFRKLHEQALAGTNDVGLRALLSFLQQWTPSQFSTRGFSLEALDQNMVFRLDGEFEHLHTRQAARDIWANLSSPTGAEVQCLITGKSGPTARLHPTIKGVKDAQSSGAALASFNLEAFRSYGKDQGENAPVTASAAFAYGTALNQLLVRGSGRSVIVGDATCVFWADARDLGEKAAKAAENFFGSALNPNEDDPDQLDASRMRAAMDSIAKGRASTEVSELDSRTRMHILGLSPNAGRISVRFWHVGTFGELACNLAQHWHDLLIQPNPFTKRAPAAWALLYETALQREAKNIHPLLGGDLMRAILNGGRYPQTLLSAVIGRIRADGEINGARAAICKAVVQRKLRLSKRTEEIPVSLDKENLNPAYLLGRLFALYEWAETGGAEKKRNATIRDKYFAAASATPARVFPVLMRGSTHNLSKLRKGTSIGLSVKLDKEIAEVLGGLSDQLPNVFPLEEQGRFVIGYYHQRQARFAVKDVETNNEDATEQED